MRGISIPDWRVSEAFSIPEKPASYAGDEIDAAMKKARATQEELDKFFVTKRVCRAGSTDWMRVMREGIPLICDEVDRIQAPITVRRIFYSLYSRLLLKNQEAQYKRLSVHLAKARKAGLLPWEYITDETRVEISPYLREPKDAAQDMPRPEHYMRDPSDAQGKYVEIWVEKATNIPLLRHIAAKWYVPLIATAGNTSVTFKHEAAERFKSRQHLECVVLYLSDLDADGQYFPVLLDEWFKEVEGIGFVEVRQVLLKHEHIKRYNLPVQPRVYKKEHERKAYVQDFIKQHGRIQVEIDALPVDDLRSLVEQEMQGLLSQRVITKVRRQSQVDARKMLVPLYKQGL